MSKHTAPPWQVEKLAEGHDLPDAFSLVVTTDVGDHVAYLSPCECSEMMANASLIAAAPAMLDALYAVAAHHVALNKAAGRDEGRSTTLRIVRAAIALAEGRSTNDADARKICGGGCTLPAGHDGSCYAPINDTEG